MWVAETVSTLQQYRAQLDGTVALVPTMGALHQAHVEHMRVAKRMAKHVIVSIYVNPMQFGPDEDFERYPRPVAKDLATCRAESVSGVFCPANGQMYPSSNLPVQIDVPQLGSILEGEYRPDHFAGVCRVVMKLLHLIQPDLATFGRKDFQQLRVVAALVADLHVPVEIVPIGTIRDSDGLALSSRNAYLGDDERRAGLGLYRALTEARQMMEIQRESNTHRIESRMHQVLESHHVMADYATIRDASTLAGLSHIDTDWLGEIVGLVAGRVGAIRLIDSMWMGEEPSI